MAANQTAHGNQFTRRAGASEPAQREIIVVGDATCITHDAAANGALQVCLHQVRSENQQVVAAEEWKVGDAIYWHSYLNAGAGGLSLLKSDALVGYAVRPDMDDVTGTNIAKPAAGGSAWINVTGEGRSKDLIVTLDFGSTAAPKTQGTYVLRDYSAKPANIAALELVHDGLLAPGTATIQLGTQADPDAIYGPVDFTAILALGAANTVLTPAVATPGLSMPEVVLTITVADATAGKLRIKLRNTAF